MVEAQQRPPADLMISLRGVDKYYDEGGTRHRIYDRVDLDMRRGEALALLGRSGSGKSTLLNLISGIDAPDAGEVWVAGENLMRLDEEARAVFRRHHIGFIFQSFNLLATLTVYENVALALALKEGRVPSHDARVMAILGEVGLASRALSFPDRLSGGEQQRVAIARALVHEPPLLLADEPTGNLDTETGAHIIALLHRLFRRRADKTLILVTHSREVAAIADRVLIVTGGRLLADAEQAP